MCRIIISLVLIVLVWNNTRTRAQSGCTMALMSLSPCLNYINGNSSSAPSSSCCSRLSSLVQSQPQCLCAMLKGGGASNLGITVNQTQALALPGACRVQTPPVSQCDAVNNNGASNSGPAPADSPGDGISEDPNTDISPSGIGSKRFPGTDGSFVRGSNNSNNSNKNGAKLSFLGFVFLLASSWVMQGTRF